MTLSWAQRAYRIGFYPAIAGRTNAEARNAIDYPQEPQALADVARAQSPRHPRSVARPSQGSCRRFNAHLQRMPSRRPCAQAIGSGCVDPTVAYQMSRLDMPAVCALSPSMTTLYSGPGGVKVYSPLTSVFPIDSTRSSSSTRMIDKRRASSPSLKTPLQMTVSPDVFLHSMRNVCAATPVESPNAIPTTANMIVFMVSSLSATARHDARPPLVIHHSGCSQNWLAVSR